MTVTEKILSVYVFDVPYSIDRPFDYICPEELSEGTGEGSIVKVPFGRSDRTRYGVVAGEAPSGATDGLKRIISVLDARYRLDGRIMRLCRFLKENTLCTMGEAFRSVCPAALFGGEGNIRVRRRYFLAPCSGTAPKVRSEGQRSVLAYLSANTFADGDTLRALPGVSAANIKSLCDKGLIKFTESEDYRDPYAALAEDRDVSPIILSDAQRRAYNEIEKLYLAPEAKAALLFGITGSGKTKVIMNMIDRVMSDGKNVIMLVPEIALTPQTVSIFCRRYGGDTAVFHSGLSDGERFDAWRRTREGRVRLVIGTRSAIFAPLENIGLIIIDEEHEHTYKSSDSSPRYHARDVAAFRCGEDGALMLLSSATPSLESFYKAKRGIYTLVPLRERYGGAELPTAQIVDMRRELREGNTSPISGALADALRSCAARGEQSILFLNRRGYNSAVSCKMCGEAVRCPHCSVALTYHTAETGGFMLCHLCGYSERPPSVCPSCGSDRMSYVGFGTQRVEGEISRQVPGASVMRMDADTTSAKFSYDRMLEDFRSRRSDVLLGTQMVTKGHDFPGVTLVGVILADTSLYVSDFRASERTFSLITQVIGRAGRAGNGGRAIIQTYSPGNDVIRLACAQDYEGFYEKEAELRRSLAFPPFCDIVQFTVTSDNEQKLAEAARLMYDVLIEKATGEFASQPITVFGPFEAQVYKVKEKFRMRMIVKCRLSRETRRLFSCVLSELGSFRGASVAADLNPLTV